MRRIINKKFCDTKTAKLVGTKYSGEFGDPAGYEEQLFVTKTKQYFIYGKGGSESEYKKETIKLITAEQFAEWTKKNLK